MKQLLPAAITLFIIALISGIEIAYFSASRLRLELNKNKGTLSGKILSEFAEKHSSFIATLLIANNIFLVIFSVLVSNYLSEVGHLHEYIPIEWLRLFVESIITTILLLTLGEFLPKVFFNLNPIRTLSLFSLPLKYLMYYPLRPLAWSLERSTRFIIKNIFRQPYSAPDYELGVTDLEYYIKEHAAVNSNKQESDDLNTQMFEKALYLREVKVRECMIPRPEIVFCEQSAGIEELKQLFIETKLSRIIICEGGIDKIVGYVHHHSLLKRPASMAAACFSIPVVPEAMAASDLFNVFIKERKNIAWVVDEFGGTAGIVTLEDVIEEIFGEIKDEHDVKEHIEQKLSESEYVFSGRLEVDYLNEKYGLGLPWGEYETLAGYVLAHHEDFPHPGEELMIDEFHVKILKVSARRIELLKVRRPKLPE